jgi:uncharacterized metal-binding protein
LKLLAASCEESSIPNWYFYFCSLTPQQAAGNALAGIQIDTLKKIKMENTSNIQIVSCSGASNTGKFSDEVARMVMSGRTAKMLCLARFSIDKTFAVNAKADIDQLIVLDGCPINCAEKTMKENGIENYTHINITDFDIVKGKTPFSAEKANEIVEHIKTIAK